MLQCVSAQMVHVAIRRHMLSGCLSLIASLAGRLKLRIADEPSHATCLSLLELSFPSFTGHFRLNFRTSNNRTN